LVKINLKLTIFTFELISYSDLKSLIIYNKLKLVSLVKKENHVYYFVIKFNYFLITKNN